MKLIKLTTIEKTDIAIVANEIVSIEKSDYDWEMEKQYGFAGRPTRILTKHCNYFVREDFDTVCTLIEEADNEGEWIEVDDSLISCKCSICGWESHMHEDDVYGMPYCPNCGAKMKGVDNETD